MVEDDLDDYRRRRNVTLQQARRRRLQLARARGESRSLVDAEPIRAHLHELMSVEWSLEAIATMNCGDGTRQGLSLIAAGRHQRVLPKFTTVLDIPVTVRVPDVIPAEMKVPSLGAVRRVRGMLALGYTLEVIAAAVGRDVAVLSGHQRPRMLADPWRRVHDAFERLTGRPGPSQETRERAARLGYLPPLAWDDIDDPHEDPAASRLRDPAGDVDDVTVERIIAGERLYADRATRVEVIRRWDATGRSRNELARLTGWKIERYSRRQQDAS